MEPLINIEHLSKSYGSTKALNDVNLTIPAGRIVGLVGPNGSGKTTMLRAMTGLISYEGNISILGVEPKDNRAELMRSTGVIHDISVLPSWMTIGQALAFQGGIHSGFSHKRCIELLEKTDIQIDSKVKQLSKGMKTQLHLAMVLATDTRLLILDEPTHGLDILFRKELYSNVLEDYFDSEKSIVISTHQVEEVEHILSDVIFIKSGRIFMYESMDNLRQRFCQVSVPEETAEQIRSLKPLLETAIFGKTVFLLENADQSELAKLGDVKTPSVVDIFIAVMGGAA